MIGVAKKSKPELSVDASPNPIVASQPERDLHAKRPANAIASQLERNLHAKRHANVTASKLPQTLKVNEMIRSSDSAMLSSRRWLVSVKLLQLDSATRMPRSATLMNKLCVTLGLILGTRRQETVQMMLVLP